MLGGQDVPFAGRGGRSADTQVWPADGKCTGLQQGGYADVTRVRASRCFGGNHHAPGCNRLLTVNAQLASRTSRKFRNTDMTYVTG